MDSVTLVAPLVVHRSSISVGALHDTGEDGVMRKPAMLTVDAVLPPADVGGVAAAVVVDGSAGPVVGLVGTSAVGARVLVGLVEVVSTDVGGLVVDEDDAR